MPQRKITVVGAGFVGSTCAQLAASKELAREVVLIDILEGRPQGIALDLNQMAAVEGTGARVIGTNDPADTWGSDVFIVTAGKPRTPGMSRSDLLETNGRVITAVADYIRAGSPDAVVIVVTNPLDIMVTLMRAKLGFPAKRVIGMAGVLDSARFCWFIAEETGTSVQDVDAMVLGAHGDSMVPMPQYCTVNGVSVLDLVPAAKVDAMADRTRGGGGEIVKLLKTGSAWYAPAAASVAMAASILNDQRRMLPCACLLNGEFGFEGLYMGVPAILGANGVERIVELPLSAESRAQMQKTAGAILSDVDALRDMGLL
ncbi:MAG: malate dehydrogenase [Planctomycetes bacterium]|nr:malate dehydrogenase [Planctomycetota bacterium]MCB9905247.1 malate dehydrogenase [Planctomycetota bacterium]